MLFLSRYSYRYYYHYYLRPYGHYSITNNTNRHKKKKNRIFPIIKKKTKIVRDRVGLPVDSLVTKWSITPGQITMYFVSFVVFFFYTFTVSEFL